MWAKNTIMTTKLTSYKVCLHFTPSFSRFKYFINDKSWRKRDQINFLFVANVVFQCYHFSKQFSSNLSKIKYFAFFTTLSFVVSLAKMVTLTNNNI